VNTSCSIDVSYDRLLSVLEEQPAWKIFGTPKRVNMYVIEDGIDQLQVFREVPEANLMKTEREARTQENSFFGVGGREGSKVSCRSPVLIGRDSHGSVRSGRLSYVSQRV
jgi:hypothetical protein